MRKFIYIALTAVAAFVTIQSCKKSGSGDSTTADATFDRKGLLTNISTNIIIPAYTAYQANTTTLDAAVSAFNAAPNTTTLAALKTAYITTYTQWQSTSAFDFGPAASTFLRVNTDSFATDVALINANIASGVTNLDALANLTAKGLPALDYLLYGNDVNTTLALFTTDGNAAKRKAYMALLSADMKSKATTVLSAWTGSYKTTFINADGTDVGSSLGQMVNQLVYDYEFLKNYEIGIPAGVQSLGAVHPEKVQAYYSGISLQLVLQHIQALQTLYMGKDGLGLDDYLIAVNATANSGGSLNDAIKNQFATATAKLQTLTNPLSANIVSNPSQVTAAYTELQKLTVLLKTDMTSRLGILITYGDNDGD